MGWLWSSSASQPSQDSSAADSSAADKSQPQSALHPTEEHSHFPPNPSNCSPFSPDPPTLQDSSLETPSSSSSYDDAASATREPRTRDQIANDEVIAYFRELQAEEQRAAEVAREEEDDDDDDDPDDDPPELMTPMRLYDTKASCSTMFDTAFACGSPGGHFAHIYRYGTIRQCGPQLRDAIMCLRYNRAAFMSESERAERTVRRAWKRERQRLKERGGSSEEIWGETRRWVVKGAFSADWEGEDSPFSKENGGGL